MNYFPNRDDAYRMMPGPAGQPALRGMVPDLPDIGWREGHQRERGIPERGGDHGEGGQDGSSRDHRSPPPGVLCSIGCSALSTNRNDSPLEEDGFEPSVPPQKTAFFRDRPESGDDK